ncbi:hypothetical protein Dsin_001785 [Dipteronia sinensis]|uniref:Reverse transcriptase n=1 Tax=Dipteronia sinensis TaxID=43782 RepID=A0AAE0B623_9ROSI|nr:hypothetical protein Dsin_001785 [Dipteronia sinensis]
MVDSTLSMDSSPKHSSLPCLGSKRPYTSYSFVLPYGSTMENPPFYSNVSSFSVFPSLLEASEISNKSLSNGAGLGCQNEEAAVGHEAINNGDGFSIEHEGLPVMDALQSPKMVGTSVNKLKKTKESGVHKTCGGKNRVLEDNNGVLEGSKMVAPSKNVIGKKKGTKDQGDSSEKCSEVHQCKGIPTTSPLVINDSNKAEGQPKCPSPIIPEIAPTIMRNYELHHKKGQQIQLDVVFFSRNYKLHHDKGISITPTLVNNSETAHSSYSNVLKGPNLDESVEILVEYQWKPKICTECKSFGHSIMTCPKLKPLHSPSVMDFDHKPKQDWRRFTMGVATQIPSPCMNLEPFPLDEVISAVNSEIQPSLCPTNLPIKIQCNVLSKETCMEPTPLGSLKVYEVISTGHAENDPSLHPTNLSIHDQCHDLSKERVVDTSNKFVALIEDGDCHNDQCNELCDDADQCNDKFIALVEDDDSSSKASPDHSLWHSKIKTLMGSLLKGSPAPQNPLARRRRKNRLLRKERLIALTLSHSLGRIWVGWGPRILNITKISETDQIIHCNACILDTNDQFRISFVYGSNDDRLRKALWQSMCSGQNGSPWIVLGDFNVSRSVGESIGGCSRISSAMKEFNDYLQSSELDDLCFSGFLYTWCNKRSNSCISRKLDRVLVNNDWLVKFENSEAIFLPPSISDHCPSVVKLGLQGIKKNRPFKIFNFLTNGADFLPLVERCWQEQVHGTMHYKLCSKLRNLKKVLKTLNNDKAGDRNSSYFFKAINGKRNRSKIHTITRDNGSLIEGDILVKKEAILHFQTILGCSRPVSHGIGSTLSNIIDKVISNEQADFMGRDVTDDKIREVCFSLHPNKAPG